MTSKEMISTINLMMGEEYPDDLLSAYISHAQEECALWEYRLIKMPEDLDLTQYDSTVINAVINGLSIRGAEGETQHSENGLLRGFKYSDMADYIHAHVTPYARIS